MTSTPRPVDAQEYLENLMRAGQDAMKQFDDALVSAAGVGVGTKNLVWQTHPPGQPPSRSSDTSGLSAAPCAGAVSFGRPRCSRADQWNVKTPPPNEADWRRRHALNIASQLPEDPADGLVILDVAREIVVTLLQAGGTGARESRHGNAHSAAPNLSA
jgi:hypothetical protein